jgi:hypothetical protein
MYKNCPDHPINGIAKSVIRTTDGACIPFSPDNTDYQQFKKDLANGVELKDANNNVMTTEQVAEFLATLP